MSRMRAILHSELDKLFPTGHPLVLSNVCGVTSSTEKAQSNSVTHLKM